ncbi:MAG: DUF169 domain-containing protein [Actinomycetota bacterium]
MARGLSEVLHPTAPPLAITFSARPPEGVVRTAEPPVAGCVFWMRGVDSTFTTVADDHAGCSVGSVTHGFKTIDEVAGNDDVATLLGSGWVTPEMVPRIPVVTERPGAVTYGPLAETPVDPDVVLIRLTAKSLMVLSDAVPGLRIEGKPQCHIVAIAKEQGEIAASVGCMLSRVRTQMPSTDMTCAIPASKLAQLVDDVRRTAEIDAVVARYAAAQLA